MYAESGKAGTINFLTQKRNYVSLLVVKPLKLWITGQLTYGKHRSGCLTEEKLRRMASLDTSSFKMHDVLDSRATQIEFG